MGMVSCAMPRRRTLLIISAAALLIGNIALFGWRAYDSTRPNAAITYVGIDSLVLSVSPSQKTTVLTKGRWNPDPRTDESVRLPAMTQSGQSLKVVVIRLGPAPNYERLIQSIRSLRAHNICHVGIVEGTGNPELARLAQTTRLSEPAHLIIFTERCRRENPGFL